MFADSPPWINVAVVTLGREDVLLDCLDDIFAQSYDRFDVTVVDQNPSLDPRLLERAKKFPERLQVLHMLPPHTCNARNLAITNTSGDVLVFVDDDTRFGPEFLRSYSKSFNSSKIGGIAGWIDATDPVFAWHPETGTVLAAIGCNMAFRRDVIEEVGGWDANFVAPFFHGEETEFASRVTRAGYEIRICSEALLFHARHITGGVRPVKKPEYWHSYISNQSLFFRKSRPIWQRLLGPIWLLKLWFTVRRLGGGMVSVGGFARAASRGFALARKSLKTKSFLISPEA